jgi:trans-2,3-dihydro-3-hydroxyanthranilate isomerase
MPTFPFVQVDAFADRPLSGNPCAIVFDADTLSPETMQAIAREQNLSETAFVFKSSIADVRARYFTASEEIPLAGHPTIATIHALVEAGRIKLTGEHTRISLELQVGPIPIDIYARGGVAQRVVMSQKRPVFLRTHDRAEVAAAFGLSPDDFLPGVPIQTVSTGTPQLMIPVRDQAVLRRTQPQLQAYARLREAGDWFSSHLFCLQGITPAAATFARHFALPPDVAEDPFTGSATGNMGAYLWHHKLIDSPSFVAEQGHWMHRPGQATVEVVGPPDDIETVKVGGDAVTVIRGQISL